MKNILNRKNLILYVLFILALSVFLYTVYRYVSLNSFEQSLETEPYNSNQEVTEENELTVGLVTKEAPETVEVASNILEVDEQYLNPITQEDNVIGWSIVGEEYFKANIPARTCIDTSPLSTRAFTGDILWAVQPQEDTIRIFSNEESKIISNSVSIYWVDCSVSSEITSLSEQEASRLLNH